MPRGAHQNKNHQYDLGARPGIGAILGLFGAPSVVDGGELSGINSANQDALVKAGEENAAGLSDSTAASSISPLTVKKPGFFQNAITGGQANQQYANLQNQIKFGQMDQFNKNLLLQKHQAGQLDLENLRSSNDITEKQSAAKLKAQEDRALEEAALNKLAAEKGFGSWNNYKQILDNPDMMTAGVKGMYADREKQGFDNAATQAKTQDILQGDIPYKQAQATQALSTAKRNGFFTLDKSQALVQPGSPESIVNADPSQYGNYPSGGPVALGGGNGGFDVTESGKLVRPVRKGVPQMLARPTGQQTPALPQFEFPKPSTPSLSLPPGYEPYRGFIEQQQQTPITEQQQQQSPRIFPLDANSQQPQNYTNPLLQFLQKKRIGMPQQFNPYSGY